MILKKAYQQPKEKSLESLPDKKTPDPLRIQSNSSQRKKHEQKQEKPEAQIFPLNPNIENQACIYIYIYTHTHRHNI
jgi:hypothetical protein